MQCVRMTGHGEYRDSVSRVSLGMGMGKFVLTVKVKVQVCT